MTGPLDKLRHLALGLLGLAACSRAADGYADAQGDAAAALARDPGVFVLDVRTAEEYAEGHLERAKLLPVHELDARLGELPEKSRPVLVYCAIGGRSARASRLLAEKGWTRVYNLVGGVSAWRAEKRPLVN